MSKLFRCPVCDEKTTKEGIFKHIDLIIESALIKERRRIKEALLLVDDLDEIKKVIKKEL